MTLVLDTDPDPLSIHWWGQVDLPTGQRMEAEVPEMTGTGAEQAEDLLNNPEEDLFYLPGLCRMTLLLWTPQVRNPEAWPGCLGLLCTPPWIPRQLPMVHMCLTQALT